MKRKGIHILTALAALFFLSGVISMALTYRDMRKWQPVNARVIIDEVVRFQTSKGTMHRGEFEMGYMVRDVPYRNVPYSLPNSFRTFEEARDDLRRFSAGTVQRILFNVEDPNEVMLDLSSPRLFFIPFLLIGCGIILAIFCVYLAWRLGRRICPRCATTIDKNHRFCYECSAVLPTRVTSFPQVL